MSDAKIVQLHGPDTDPDRLLSLPPCPERDCDICGAPTRGDGFGWWMQDIGCNRCTGLDSPPDWSLEPGGPARYWRERLTAERDWFKAKITSLEVSRRKAHTLWTEDCRALNRAGPAIAFAHVAAASRCETELPNCDCLPCLARVALSQSPLTQSGW